MEESREGPVPRLFKKKRKKVRHEPESESEQYPSLRYDDFPPIPPWVTLVPPGMVGYEEAKKEQMKEAQWDRKVRRTALGQEQGMRWIFIAKLAVRFPQVGVQRIAEEVVPWDVEEFKRRVVEAQTRFYEEAAR